MAKVKITLTDDIIKLFPFIRVDDINDTEGVALRPNDLFYEDGVIRTCMMAWGELDNYIPESKDSWEGPQYSQELNDRAWDAYDYLKDNLADILSIILVYSTKGGVEVGEYERLDREPGLWKQKVVQPNGNVQNL